MKKKIWGALLLALLGFIWGHSMMSPEDSSNESLWLLQLLTPLLELFFGPGQVTHYLIRKLAHFAEFAALGFLLYGNATCWTARRQWCMAGQLGLLAAFLDETIQIFSGRGAQIQDVWLDFSGVIAGILFGLFVFWLAKKMGRVRK